MGDTFPVDYENMETSGQIFRCQKNPLIEFHEISTHQVIQLKGPNPEFRGFDYAFVLTEKNAEGFFSIEDPSGLEWLSERKIPWVLLRTHADLLVHNDQISGEQKKLTLNSEREALRKSLEKRNLLKDETQKPLVKLIDAKSVVEFDYLEALEDLL